MAQTTSSQSKKPASRTRDADAAPAAPVTRGQGEPAAAAPVAAAQPAPADDALFVREEDNTPDGTLVQPGQPFTKVWVLRNSGTTAWDGSYRLTLVGGTPLGATASVNAPVTPPGGEARFTVNFAAPATSGFQRSTWKLVNPAGQAFGEEVWTEVTVATAMAQTNGVAAATFPPPAAQALPMPTTASSAVQAVVSTWNRYGGMLLEEAQRLNIDPSVAVAVLVTESAGDGFENGRMKIRFENHIFNAYWGKNNAEQFARHFTFDPTETWKGHQWRADANAPWQPCHQSQDVEWQVFDFARGLDERAAMYSISMGAPQIMGFNHTSVGYSTVQAMFDAFQSDARSQLASLFRFMEVNGLVQAVRDGNYTAFARVYNGPGQAEYYAGLIRDYVAAFAGASAAAGRGIAQPGVARSPQPATTSGKSLKEEDPELYAAWSKHIQQGFENNQVMFGRVLDAFLNPYWTTVWMYRTLFGVGIAAFVLAGALAIFQANLGATVLFGGLSVAAFLSFFISKPLQALEENLQFITWLGIIYNSYWTRLVQAQDPNTFETIIKEATGDAIEQIQELMKQHGERSTNRPGLR